MREIVCGPGSPLEGLAALLPARSERNRGVKHLTALAGLALCAVLLALATGWWAFLVVPAYLVAVALMALLTHGSALRWPLRLLLGVGLPAASLGLIVWLVRLVAGV